MMKKHSTTKDKGYTQEEIKEVLNKCRKQIKLNNTRQDAIQTLEQLDFSIMNPKNKKEYLYINGRYHYYLHKDHGDIEALEWSNDYLDDMASYAYEQKLSLEMPQLYTRTYVKYLLGNLVWDEERKPWLHSKAKKITERMVVQYPANSSFKWLNQLLTS